MKKGLFIVIFLVCLSSILFASDSLKYFLPDKLSISKKNYQPKETSTSVSAKTNKMTTEPKKNDVEMVEYDGIIRHLFFHCLIAFPEASNSSSLGVDCITVSEFKNVLNELYKNDYILVDINDTFEISYDSGKISAKKKSR